MSLMYADLTGIPLIKAMLVIPLSGIWHADVILDRAVGPAPSGPQALTLAGSTWTCSPIRAIDYSDRREIRLVGGQGGWRDALPFQPYASPAGVPTSLVLSDAAAAVGELPPVVDPSVPSTLGTYWCRQSGRASLLLQQVLGSQWWMDATGTVQTKPRIGPIIATPFDAINVEGYIGRYQIATETPSDWMPGATFVGATVSGTISRVTHVLEAGSLRTEVLSSP